MTDGFLAVMTLSANGAKAWQETTGKRLALSPGDVPLALPIGRRAGSWYRWPGDLAVWTPGSGAGHHSAPWDQP